MDVLTFVFGLALMGGGGVLAWRMSRLESDLARTHQETLEELDCQRASQRSTLVAMHHTLASLEAGTQAILSTQPHLEGRIALYSAIARSESILDKQNVTMTDLKEGGGALISSVRDLVSTLDGEGTLDEGPLQDVGLRTLARRLFVVLDRCGLGPADLALNGLECKRLGLLAHSIGEVGWAMKCYECANLQSPGDTSCLKILETLAERTGDTRARRHWLEERLARNPDDADLLRRHAHLMVNLDEAAAERDVKRLQALGLDTPADRSLLSGLRRRAGERNEALDSLDKALEEDPSRVDDWATKARLHLELEEPDEALIAADATLSLDRQNGDAWAVKAQVLSKRPSEIKAALKAAIHAVALESGGTELILLKADLLSADGRKEEGEECLDKALEADPNNSDLRSSMAAIALVSADLDKASTLLRATPIESLQAPSIHIQRGRLQLALADLQRDGTGETDNRLLLIAKESFDEALRLDREQGIGWLGLARIQRQLGDRDAAEISLTRASRLLDEDQPALAIESAMLALERGEMPVAERLVENASIHDTRSATIPYIKGNIASARGEFNIARSFYSEALTIDDSHSRARLNRIACMMAMDEAHLAIDDCNLLLEKAPELHLARLRRAEAHMHLAEWPEALEDLEVVLDHNPRHSHALTRAAGCYIALGRPEAAEAPLNEALRIDPDNAGAWHQRGLLYMEWGRVEAALADFEKAVKADPGHLDARLHIAASHHGSGRWEEAAGAWREVLEADPSSDVARHRLEQCESNLLESTLRTE